MSIQNRLLVLFALIFIVGFGVFALYVSRLPSEVLREINAELLLIATEVREQATNLEQMDVSDLSFLPPLKAESTFLVVTDANQVLINQSPNMADISQVLDPGGFGAERIERAVTFDDQTLQVLTLPIRQDSDGNTQIVGYLQVGRLITDYRYYQQLTTAAVFIGLAALTASLLVTVWQKWKKTNAPCRVTDT